MIEKVQQFKKNIVLKKISKMEYEKSRGKQHLEILLNIQKFFIKKLTQIQKQKNKYDHVLSQSKKKTQDLLFKKLEQYIVTTKIFEVPGIGKKLGNSIIRNVYKTSITDLRNSYRIHGIGDEKQNAINQWINKNRKEMPKLINSNFPGKDEIIKKASVENASTIKKIHDFHEHIIKIEDKLKTIEFWVSRLEKVTKKDVINARIMKQYNAKEIGLFFKGVFGEWEQIPKWLVDLINESKNV